MVKVLQKAIEHAKDIIIVCTSERYGQTAASLGPLRKRGRFEREGESVRVREILIEIRVCGSLVWVIVSLSFADSNWISAAETHRTVNRFNLAPFCYGTLFTVRTEYTQHILYNQLLHA